MTIDLTAPVGRLLVLDIEGAPDPDAVGIAGRGDQMNRIALHRVEGYSTLAATETADGSWRDIALNSAEGEPEIRLLAGLGATLDELRREDGLLVSYNGRAYDAEVLRRRVVANWAFGNRGIAELDRARHLDLTDGRRTGRTPPSLRDACAGIGITATHLKIPHSREPASAVVRKSQVDCVATFLLLLHEIALARGKVDPLRIGWKAVSEHLGRPLLRAPHLEQFRLPAILSGRTRDVSSRIPDPDPRTER